METAAIYCRVTDKRSLRRGEAPLSYSSPFAKGGHKGDLKIPLNLPFPKGEAGFIEFKERGTQGVRLVTNF